MLGDDLGQPLRETRLAAARRHERRLRRALPARERNPFLELDNVVLTPHLGAVTGEANARSRAMPVDNIIAYMEGHAVNVVNP